MKHNYSNADIRRATVYAGLDVHAADIRLILDALPEPATDDCQEAPFIPVADVQKGDRVRIANWQDAHEVNVTEVDPVTIYWEHGHTPKKYVTSVRLLDRPVQHPDPEVHPVIIIYRPNGNGETPVSYAWTGQHYRSFDGQEYFSSNEISDWFAAKVVEDDR